MTQKAKLILKGSSFRAIQTLVTIALGFLMMPFMINTLGEELYGLWVVVASLVGAYYLLDMGFSQAITRYVAKYIHQNNPTAANRVINTALVLYSSLGVVVLLISIVAAKYGAESLMESSEHVSLAQTLLILSGLTLALEFPAKSFPGILGAYLRFDFIAIVRVTKTVIDSGLIFLFLSNGYGLVAVAVITLITGIISTVIYVRFTSSLFVELRFSRDLVDFITFKDVFHFSKWVFVFDLNAMLRDKLDIWFIAYYQSSAVLTVYYVAVRLADYAVQLLNQITGFTGTIFTEYYAKAEHHKLKQSVLAFIKINVAFGTVFFVGFYLVGKSAIVLWMGRSFAFEDAYLCLTILSIGRLSIYFGSPLQSLLMTLNRHSIGAWLSVVETLVSASLLFVLIPPYGIAGAALAITIPSVISRLLVLPILVGKIIDIELQSLIARFCCFLGLTAVFIMLCRYSGVFEDSLSIIELFIAAPLIGAAQMIIGVVLFTKGEILWAINLLKRKMNRKALLESINEGPKS